MAWFISNTLNVFTVVFWFFFSPPRCKRSNGYHQKSYFHNLRKFIYFLFCKNTYTVCLWFLVHWLKFILLSIFHLMSSEHTMLLYKNLLKKKKFLKITQSSNIALSTTHHILLIISQSFSSHKAEKEADDTVSMPKERVRQVSKRTPGGRRIQSLQLWNPSSIRCKDYMCFKLALYAKDYHMYSFCTEKGWLGDKM